jgi:hypothetical protein
MKVRGLDCREYNWDLTGHVPIGTEQSGSSYHARARALLEKLFPTDNRLEEVPLPGTQRLVADFYLPARRMIIEVHGEQHYKFISHFHGTRLGFFYSCQRDLKKREWCEINNIRYIELPYWGDDGEWTTRLS